MQNDQHTFFSNIFLKLHKIKNKCKSSYWNTELHPGLGECQCLCIFCELGSQQQARAIQVRALARQAANLEQSYGLQAQSYGLKFG
jgi:hypothetical protein